ncbi:MAG: exosortase-associated EpsI family protein [Lentisphaeria bacterium]|nr:exosortase-associated EpsI family protein [Lentisphaeria bacterium]
MNKQQLNNLMYPQHGLPLLLCIAGFFPLLTKMPYMIRAWGNSPLDRPDLIFLALFLIMLAVSLPKILSRRQTGRDWLALTVMLPALLLFSLSFVFRINALGIVAAIAFAWATFGFSLGWNSALTAAPAFGTLLMTCTSSRYWLTFFFTPLQIDGLIIKLAFTGLCMLFLIVLLFRQIRITPANFCFLIMLAPAFLLLLHGQTSHTLYPPIQPSFEKLKSGNFIGRPAEITDLDRRFFEDAILNKYYFASELQAVNVLNVTCSDNIQKIHPASHCLRSSGWKIRSETQQEIELQNKKIALTEIVGQKQQLRVMTWVWYSSQYRSVGNFIRFRSLYPSWKDDEIWHEYQITTPLANDEKHTRKTLAEFLNQLE